MKPTVRYSKREGFLVVGESALIYPIDHPSQFVSNTTMAHTSPVVFIDPNGRDFETQNTKYVFDGAGNPKSSFDALCEASAKNSSCGC